VGASVVVVVVVTAGTLCPSFCFGLQSRITADRVNSNKAITAKKIGTGSVRFRLILIHSCLLKLIIGENQAMPKTVTTSFSRMK